MGPMVLSVAGSVGATMLVIGLHARHLGMAPYRITVGVPFGLALVVAFPLLVRLAGEQTSEQASIVFLNWVWKLHTSWITAAWTVTIGLLTIGATNGVLRRHAIRRECLTRQHTDATTGV